MLELTTSQAIAYLCLALITVWATASDLKTRKIPNLLTVTAFLCGVVFQILFHGWGGVLTGLGGFAIGFGTFFVLWMTGGGGGGDVKLMGALGMWLGARPTLYVLFLSTLLVLILSIFIRPKSAAANGDGKPAKVQAGKAVALALPVTLAVWSLVVLDRLVTARDLLSF